MKWLQLFALARRLPIRALMNVPDDFYNVSQVKPWVQAYTDTDVDDTTLRYVERALMNPEVWEVILSLLSCMPFITGSTTDKKAA